jgi:hypothetical protein
MLGTRFWQRDSQPLAGLLDQNLTGKKMSKQISGPLLKHSGAEEQA